MSKKCIINGCENRNDQGEFHGDLCCPCHEYISNNKGNNSQAQINEEQIIMLRKYLRSLKGLTKGKE
jgi:hypothetical protein